MVDDSQPRLGGAFSCAEATPPCPGRRTFLARSLTGAGLLTVIPAGAVGATMPVIDNVTGLYAVEVARVVTPLTVQDVVEALRAWPGRIAVGGGRFSMGGQSAIRAGLHLDMRAMNGLVWLKPEGRTARVQAGMRWRDLQDALDPLDLAVATMQSYANFTVGGAVSVNAHGRYVGHGAVGSSVRALQVVLADGRVVEASRQSNATCFRAVIGGYGAVGVITEVELDLASNVRIEREVVDVALARYADHFARRVRADATCVLHNADLAPPRFDAPTCVTWRRTDKPSTDPARLTARGARHAAEQNVLFALTELPGGDALRHSVLRPMLTGKPAVKWLNREASLDVAELEPRTRRISTYVLQEYFIPERNFLPFARALAATLQQRQVAAVNVSIRHSPADTVSLLPWAAEDVFSFVLYYKQRTHAAAREAVGHWTRELIELALANGGRYYLPYQLHASQDQFERAYPEVAALRQAKRALDPQGRFSNELWARYL